METKPNPLQTSVQKLPVKQLRHLEVNARYMTAQQQQRLTENIKRDGGLTSLPLVWLIQDESGKAEQDPAFYEIISGNHRVTSARDAGFAEIEVIVIENWIPKSRRVEIQLSHNAVEGQDDLSVLEGLYEYLDLDGKEYSGLTDEVFNNLNDLSLGAFGVGAPDYQELTVSFLPDDADQFTALLERVEKKAKASFHAAHISDFDKMFDAIVRVKERENVLNSAVAIHFVAQLALERLDQLEEAEAELVDNDDTTEGEGPDASVLE